MSDAFDEYTQATNPSSGVEQRPKMQAPRFPGPEAPMEIPPDPRPPKVPEKKVEYSLFWPSLILFVLAFLLFMFSTLGVPTIKWVGPTHEILPDKPRLTEQSVKKQTSTSGRVEISRLEKDVQWLKTLLKKSKRKLKVERENHATTKARLNRALKSNNLDLKYEKFLRHALNQFYTQPFKPNEKQRTICFTTQPNDRECWQMSRPVGWFEGETIFPKPAQLRRF